MVARIAATGHAGLVPLLHREYADHQRSPLAGSPCSPPIGLCLPATDGGSSCPAARPPDVNHSIILPPKGFEVRGTIAFADRRSVGKLISLRSVLLEALFTYAFGLDGAALRQEAHAGLWSIHHWRID